MTGPENFPRTGISTETRNITRLGPGLKTGTSFGPGQGPGTRTGQGPGQGPGPGLGLGPGPGPEPGPGPRKGQGLEIIINKKINWQYHFENEIAIKQK